MTQIDRAGRNVHFTILTLTYLFLYIPILVLLIFSFNSERFPSPWTSFTFHWYKELFFSSPILWNAFANSLIISSCATALSLLFGLLLMLYAARGGAIQRILGFFYGNVIIPEIVLAVALLGFFTLIKIPLGLATLIVAHTILGLGFVVPILYVRFQELDYRMTEASLVLGATEMQTFYKVILPNLKPAIISTAVLVFVLSFDDFVLSYFCAGSDAQTLSLYILSMLRSEISPVVNAISALHLFLSTALALLFFSIKSRSRIW